MKNAYFLNCLKKWSKGKKLPGPGLCCCFFFTKHKNIIDLFVPTEKDDLSLTGQGNSNIYWGYEKDKPDSKNLNFFQYLKYQKSIRYELTSLRQTILCFCAAINNEFED